MWLNYGRFAARLAGAGLLGISLGIAFDDSKAQAGFLKNSVRVGDRSAMNLVGKPTPGQKKLIRTPVFARPKADPDQDSGAGGSRGVAAQTWFWQAHSTALADASPGRWAEALASLRDRRAGGKSIYDEGRLQDIAERYETDIAAAARKHGVSELLLVAVIAVESAGSDKAVSPKGARGLMQLIPATARRFGVSDSFDPAQNILGGAAYLDWLLKAFNEDPILALAGYNAGEGAIESNNGVPPYAETRDYVVKVFDALAAAEALCRVPADTPRRACGWSSSPRT